MTPPEIDAFFRALEAALTTFPLIMIPVDIDGKKHVVGHITSWDVPADIVDLLEAHGAIARLRKLAESYNCRIKQNKDRSLTLVWSANPPPP
jgi:hypothetical protein